MNELELSAGCKIEGLASLDGKQEGGRVDNTSLGQVWFPELWETGKVQVRRRHRPAVLWAGQAEDEHENLGGNGTFCIVPSVHLGQGYNIGFLPWPLVPIMPHND